MNLILITALASTIGTGAAFALGAGVIAAEKASTFAPKVAATAITIAPYVLTTAVVALAGWSYYKAGEYFINMFWSLDRTLNSPQFWGLYYGYPNNKQNW